MSSSSSTGAHLYGTDARWCIDDPQRMLATFGLTLALLTYLTTCVSRSDRVLLAMVCLLASLFAYAVLMAIWPAIFTFVAYLIWPVSLGMAIAFYSLLRCKDNAVVMLLLVVVVPPVLYYYSQQLHDALLPPDWPMWVSTSLVLIAVALLIALVYFTRIPALAVAVVHVVVASFLVYVFLRAAVLELTGALGTRLCCGARDFDFDYFGDSSDQSADSSSTGPAAPSFLRPRRPLSSSSSSSTGAQAAALPDACPLDVPIVWMPLLAGLLVLQVVGKIHFAFFVRNYRGCRRCCCSCFPCCGRDKRRKGVGYARVIEEQQEEQKDEGNSESSASSDSDSDSERKSRNA